MVAIQKRWPVMRGKINMIFLRMAHGKGPNFATLAFPEGFHSSLKVDILTKDFLWNHAQLIWLNDLTDDKLTLGQGDGLVSSDTKPLPESMLNKLYNTMWHYQGANDLTDWPPRGCVSNFKSMIFKLIIQNDTFVTHREIAHRWNPQNLTNESQHRFR